MNAHLERRTLLRAAVIGGSAAVFGGTLWRGAAHAAPAQPGAGPYGALAAPDANGIRLPAGFTSRVVARSGRTVTLVVKGARRANNDHARGEWVRRIVGRLDKRRVKVLFAQL